MQSEICNNCIEFHGSGRMGVLRVTLMCDKFQTYGKSLRLEAALKDETNKEIFFLILSLEHGQTVSYKVLEKAKARGIRNWSWNGENLAMF